MVFEGLSALGSVDRAVVEHVEEEHVAPHAAVEREPRQEPHVPVDVDGDVAERRRVVGVGRDTDADCCRRRSRFWVELVWSTRAK